MLRRSPKSSDSRMAVTSWPSTVIRPASGFSSPSASFKVSVLPVPAVPIRILVSPRGSSKEIPCSTGVSKPISTFSKRMMASPGGETRASACSTGGARLAIVLVFEKSHQQPRDEEVAHQDKHRRCHDGLSGGSPDALSTAFGGKAVITSDAGNNKTEKRRLTQPHENIAEAQRLVRRGPVLVGIETQQ